LKYIDSLTLKSAEAKGIEALKKDTLDVEPATGIFPHHNASVQCNICHN